MKKSHIVWTIIAAVAAFWVLIGLYQIQNNTVHVIAAFLLTSYLGGAPVVFFCIARKHREKHRPLYITALVIMLVFIPFTLAFVFALLFSMSLPFMIK